MLERSRSDLALKLEGLQQGKDGAGGAFGLEAKKETARQRAGDLTDARRDMEQSPSRSNLAALEARCSAATDFLRALPATLGSGSSPECTAAALKTGAARLFALNDGRRQLADQCLRGEAQPEDKANFDTQVLLARNCLVWSALLPTQTAKITSKIDALERERDDKAHRFVVTTNAFLDNNKLAMLAAGIASAIDLLVLASGLLGALVLRPKVMGVRTPAASKPAVNQAAAAWQSAAQTEPANLYYRSILGDAAP